LTSRRTILILLFSTHLSTLPKKAVQGIRKLSTIVPETESAKGEFWKNGSEYKAAS
jgi:hypothetical protein